MFLCYWCLLVLYVDVALRYFSEFVINVYGSLEFQCVPQYFCSYFYFYYYYFITRMPHVSRLDLLSDCVNWIVSIFLGSSFSILIFYYYFILFYISPTYSALGFLVQLCQLNSVLRFSRDRLVTKCISHHDRLTPPGHFS